MRKIFAKCLAALLITFSCCLFTACEVGMFAHVEVVGEPTLTVIQEADGEYTAIVEGYAKNYSGKMAYRSEAVALLF